MTREQLIDISHQWISLWSAPVNWELFNKLHSKNFEDMSTGGRGKTKQDFANGIKNLLDAFPDIKTKIEDLVIDESTQCAAVRWSAVGTNKQNYLGIGPTNRVTKIAGIEIIEISNGQIAKRWGEWDISAHHP